MGETIFTGLVVFSEGGLRGLRWGRFVIGRDRDEKRSGKFRDMNDRGRIWGTVNSIPRGATGLKNTAIDRPKNKERTDSP